MNTIFTRKADTKVAVTTTIGGVSTTYFERQDSPLPSHLSGPGQLFWRGHRGCAGWTH
ncbi:MAG: hypothetical protein II943_12420 [Victivallales bacterium]|nr:hypothetical protein [Victivallales bacterium]